MTTDIDPDSLGWLTDPPPPGSPADVPYTDMRVPASVRISGLASTGQGLPIPPPMLVTGSSGGSGSTIVTLGLASAMAIDNLGYVHPAAIDATPAGGDLSLRGCDLHNARTTATMQTWLADTSLPVSLPSVVEAACSRSSAGLRIMSRSDAALPRRETLVSVHGNVIDAGFVPIYDAGAPVRARSIRPLLCDPRVPIAITVAARPDAINRLNPVMAWLDAEFGEYMASDVTIVVTRQTNDPAMFACTEWVRVWGRGHVRSVVEIPYDEHLGEGRQISWHHLAPATQAAFRLLLEEMR